MHAERGEELFLIEHTSEGMVRFTVRVLSRPGHFLISLGAPIARVVQRRVTTRYLQAMVGLVGYGLC